MTIYVIMIWDNGEQCPEGHAFVNRKLADKYSKGTDNWLSYVEVDLNTTVDIKR